MVADPESFRCQETIPTEKARIDEGCLCLCLRVEVHVASRGSRDSRRRMPIMASFMASFKTAVSRLSQDTIMSTDATETPPSSSHLSQDTVMSTTTTETPPSGPVVSLENLLFDFPEADVVLRSRDSYDFRVLKIYIVHSSPILGEKVLLFPDPSANPTESDVPCVVQLPIGGAALFSLLTYIFPVHPELPAAVEHVMELLSVAQMYKMDVVLAQIRNDVAQQEPPFIREETAFLIYSLAQEHGLRSEALEAAQCTLSVSSLTIEGLAKDDKLAMMPGTFLHELWKYHQRVQSNRASALDEFRKSNAHTILGDLSCCQPSVTGLPYWLDKYLFDLYTTWVPGSLDLTDFHMKLTEHIHSMGRKKGGCTFCAGIPQTKIRTLWGALTDIIHGSISKVRVSSVAASPNGPERLSGRARFCTPC
jgi:hypothetical protein